MAQSSRCSRSERAKREPCVNGLILARYKISFLMMFPGKGQKEGDNKDISYQDNADLWLQSASSASGIRLSNAIPHIRGGIQRVDLHLRLVWKMFSSHYP